MTTKDMIEKYEKRNKSRMETIKEGKFDKLHYDLLSLYVETEEIINDLKQLENENSSNSE